MQIKNIYLIVFFSMLFFSCQKKYEVTSPGKYFGSIVDKTVADSSSYQKLSTVFPFEWDRIIVLQPYQHPFLKDCGYQFDLPDTRIENTEGLHEYLLIKDNKLIKHLIYDDTYKNNISLVVDSSIYTLCGIENTPDLYIKFRSDSGYDFMGKSYTIFKK